MVASEEGTSEKNVFGLLNEQFVKLEQTFVEQKHTIKQLKTLMMTKDAENYFFASSRGGNKENNYHCDIHYFQVLGRSLVRGSPWKCLVKLVKKFMWCRQHTGDLTMRFVQLFGNWEPFLLNSPPLLLSA